MPPYSLQVRGGRAGPTKYYAIEVHDHQTLVRDPSDVPVALSAIHANVYCLVSEDKDLTNVDASTEELRGLLTVTRPVIFLRKIMGWSSEDLEKIRHRNWPVEEA